jgi:hypothetical protein
MSNSFAAFLGAILMLVALACSNVTVASGRYRGVLLISLACTTAALACLSVPWRRGPGGWRVAAAALALPTTFILWDFLRRAPAVFTGP